METINILLELFPYAIIGSIIAGIICSFLGVFIVSQRAVFLGASLTQVSVAGVAFAFLHLINLEDFIASVIGVDQIENTFLHHFEHTFFSLLFSIIVVLIFSQTFKQKKLTQDSVLGIIFVVAIALRIILVQISPVAEVAEIESILKGDILFIGSQELFTLLVLLVVILTFFLLFYKQLRFVTFDAETATAMGFNSRFWLLLFYLMVGIGISITTRFVGDVFTFAYLLFPALIGIVLAKKVNNVFFIAVAIGAIIPPLSIYFAFILDVSSGPTAVISAFIVFIFVYLFKRKIA